MEWLHALFAVLAAFRIATLLVSDAVWQPVRARFPAVPWHCGLCMSVWAGGAATALMLLAPWLNWPLAISWLYLAYKRGLKLDSAELEARVNAMHTEYQLHISALTRRATELSAELTSAARREAALREEIETLKSDKGSA